MSMSGPVFAARRALWAILLNLLMGLLLAGITILNLVRQIREDGSPMGAALFAVLAFFFLWQALNQLRNRVPLIEIGPGGLRLPGASEDTLPWQCIRQVRPASGFAGLGGGRIDFTVDGDVFDRMKFGQRFMGDVVVKRRAMPHTFSLITPQLDASTDTIYAAIKQYWPARRPDEPDEE
jgi:hypothetical protein